MESNEVDVGEGSIIHESRVPNSPPRNFGEHGDISMRETAEILGCRVEWVDEYFVSMNEDDQPTPAPMGSSSVHGLPPADSPTAFAGISLTLTPLMFSRTSPQPPIMLRVIHIHMKSSCS